MQIKGRSRKFFKSLDWCDCNILGYLALTRRRNLNSILMGLNVEFVKNGQTRRLNLFLWQVTSFLLNRILQIGYNTRWINLNFQNLSAKILIVLIVVSSEKTIVANQPIKIRYTFLLGIKFVSKSECGLGIRKTKNVNATFLAKQAWNFLPN